MSVLGQPEPFRVSHHDLVHAALVEVPDSKREFKVIIRRINKWDKLQIDLLEVYFSKWELPSTA